MRRPFVLAERRAPSLPRAAGLLLAAVACALPAAAPLSAAEGPVTAVFVVEPVRPGAGTLVIAWFGSASAEWDKRFKRAERADLYCRKPVDGGHVRETLSCELPAGPHIGLAFVDRDGNGTLTHGALGPTEQYGVTGYGKAFVLPPPVDRTIIDVRDQQTYHIVLN